MKVVNLNEELLSLICMVQSAKNLFICEQDMIEFPGLRKPLTHNESMNTPDAINTRLMNYFGGFNAGYINHLGLKVDQKCLEAIGQFRVTREILETPTEELDRFQFTY